MLYNLEGDLSPDVAEVTSAARRSGPAATSRSSLTAAALFKALEAAEALAREGVEAEVIDLRVVAAARHGGHLESVAGETKCGDRRRGLAERTLRPKSACGSPRKLSSTSTRPLRRVCGREVPMPYAPHLEDACLPQAAGDRGGGARTRPADMIEFKMPALGADMEWARWSNGW